MAFTINTNITSLQAQEYLRTTGDFQAKTINRVTSGLRIVSSGDDAAGLAIANGFRSDQAVLGQGIRNANDGLSTLQTIDGGISNISKLLDRARTLATQSASGTFSGSRSVLNSEFQSVLAEIDRQAQAIGLNSNGEFAKTLSVFIGGGRASGGTTQVDNGSVSVDLSKSAVDTNSLGLRASETVATGGDFTSTTGSVSAIKADNGNATSTTFTFYGAGFTSQGANKVSVTVQLSGVNDAATLAAAVNAAIQGASPSSAEAIAFKNAGISAAVSPDGKSLVFSSSKQPFQVEAGDVTASALMGFMAAPGTNGIGLAVGTNNVRLESGGVQTSQVVSLGTALAKGTSDKQVLTISANDAGGAMQTIAVTLDATKAAGATLTTAEVLDQINSTLQNSGNATLKNIVAVNQTDAAGKIRFISNDPAFAVTVGAGTGGHGLQVGGSQNVIDQSTASTFGASSTADIGTADGAEAAVNALAAAVQALGEAQAVVGKGANNFNYAISLASTQLTNLAASESRIRDADLALEAANLTKAQILQQAGIAALAQANSAPQAVLSLLRG
jgi:flagellin